MPEPDYGNTPVDPDDATAFQPRITEALGYEPLKADVYELEQRIQDEVAEVWLSKVEAGELGIGELLDPLTVLGLHRDLYTDIWQWAGIPRHRELSIGVLATEVLTALEASLGNLAYQWTHVRDEDPRKFALRVHAEVARIHPFTDGNGRASRLLADLVYADTQQEGIRVLFDWNLDKERYIAALREYDKTRTIEPLNAVVGDLPLAQPGDDLH